MAKLTALVAAMVIVAGLQLSHTASLENHELLRELFKLDENLMGILQKKENEKTSRKLLISSPPMWLGRPNKTSNPSEETGDEGDIVVNGLKENLKSKQELFRQKIEEIVQLIDDGNVNDAEKYLHLLLEEVSKAKQLVSHALTVMNNIDEALHNVLVKLEQHVQQTKTEVNEGLELIAGELVEGITGEGPSSGGTTSEPNGGSSTSGSDGDDQSGTSPAPGVNGDDQSGTSPAPGDNGDDQSGTSSAPGDNGVDQSGTSSAPDDNGGDQSGTDNGGDQSGTSSAPGDNGGDQSGTSPAPGDNGGDQSGTSSAPGDNGIDQSGTSPATGDGDSESSGTSSAPGSSGGETTDNGLSELRMDELQREIKLLDLLRRLEKLDKN